jgi:hypothetical protein
MAGTGKKTGRPHKGPRTQITVKIPDQLLALIMVDAKDRGIDRVAWIVDAVAEKLGQPNPFAVQEALQLTDAA